MKFVFIVLGMLFMGIGVIGIYLPLLPTTPFFILAAACFGRGSDKFHHWFTHTPMYLKNIEPIVNKKGMTLKRKCKILATIGLFIAISFYFMSNIYGRSVLVFIFFIHVYYFFVRVKTVNEEKL